MKFLISLLISLLSISSFAGDFGPSKALWESMGTKIAECAIEQTDELVMIKYCENVGDENVLIYSDDNSVDAGLYGRPNTLIKRNDDNQFLAKVTRKLFKKNTYGFIKLDKQTLTGSFYIKKSTGEITKGKLVDCDFF